MTQQADKPPLELLPVRPLIEAAYVLEMGTAKRGEQAGWQNGVSYNKYCGKILRHLFAFMQGVDLDEESGRSHLAHLMVDAAIMLDCQKRGLGTDDRSGK